MLCMEILRTAWIKASCCYSASTTSSWLPAVTRIVVLGAIPPIPVAGFVCGSFDARRAACADSLNFVNVFFRGLA